MLYLCRVFNDKSHLHKLFPVKVFAQSNHFLCTGYAADAKHMTDLNADNLKGGDDFDPEFVLSCRVRTGRSVRGRALPPVCTRAERKDVEAIVVDGLDKLEGDFSGNLAAKWYTLPGVQNKTEHSSICV